MIGMIRRRTKALGVVVTKGKSHHLRKNKEPPYFAKTGYFPIWNTTIQYTSIYYVSRICIRHFTDLDTAKANGKAFQISKMSLDRKKESLLDLDVFGVLIFGDGVIISAIF